MYNRLFTKILDSSIWLEADTTRLIWITILASMDEDGYAAFSAIENLARRANIPIDATVTAVTVLESPDKFSPHDEFQGRRIERVDGGWMVLKAPYYRGLLTREIAREQTRIRVARHREKKSNVTNQPLPNVTSVTPDIDNDIASVPNKAKCSQKEAEDFCQSIGVKRSDGEWFFHKCEGNGWTNGGRPIKSWKATLQQWKTAEILPSQKAKSHAPRPYAEQGRSMWNKLQPAAHNLEAYKTPKFAPELTDEQIAKNKAVIAVEKAKLIEKFKLK